MKTCFYRAEHVSALERKKRIWTAVFALVCAVTAGFCVFFILLVFFMLNVVPGDPVTVIFTR